MGCATSSQMDNVTPPSSVYLQSQQQLKIATQPQPISEEIKSQTQNEPAPILITSLNHIPQVNSVKVIDFTESPECKKQEQRTATAATQQLKHEAMKHVPQGKAFIFGQSEQQRKILLLDCQKMQFSILSNRTQMPNTPHKYMPKDVIFQQSQELLSSNLFNSNSRPPYNFMFITFISDDTIFLSGGINYSFDYISDQSFFFKVASIANEQPQPRRKKGGNNNLVGNKFQKLAPMRQKRYSHMGAYFRMGKLGYIYVFGGSFEDEQLLSSCQQYSLYSEKWREITPMKHPRSTGFSLIFKNKIYVFGGYTADKKRSKTIQAYDPYKNYWENLNVKLHRGIQAGLLFSVKSNEVLLMGGNVESGALKSVIRINLAEETYIWDSTMKNQRLLQKGVKFNDLIYVFGGDFQDSFEKYSIKDRKWKDHQFSYNEFVSIDDINSYRMATETLEVPYDETLLSKQDNSSNDFERYHIFGNDNFPAILQLNLTKWVLKKKPVPMALRLRNHMGVAKLQQGKYFVCGGIDSFGQKPSRAAFIYYAGTNRAIQVGKMSSKKYNFAICSTPKNVYIFGGKNQSGEIISECQKFNFDQQKWISLPNLPSQRSNSKALLFGSKIFLIGGVDMLQSVTIIDIFDTETDTFLQHKQILSIPSQIKAISLQQQKQNPAGIFILSYNEVLSKYSCHYLPLKIDENKIQEEQMNEKIQDNFSLVKQIQERQINIKIPAFTQAFSHQNRLHLITPKGLLSWEPKNNQKIQHKFQSQIVINQVEMLQFPIQKFSYPILSNIQTSI